MFGANATPILAITWRAVASSSGVRRPILSLNGPISSWPTANPIEYDFVQEVLLRARAYDHGVAIAYANYCGVEGALVYGGLSTICGPGGAVLAAAGREPELVIG